MSTVWSPAPSVRRTSIRRRPSKVDFRDSEDSRTVTATFDLPGVAKENIHISFQPQRLVVTWETVTVSEKKEVNRVVRERRERKYIRTIPLARDTKFEDIKATMDGRYLFIVYPKPRAPESRLAVEVAIE
ncbi:HSP20-like chaperone [Auricularia subglabra TFB-10046 SS5]|nr:HSP20-like chaperone [Auricularia subglabra TFB-10046 SS5]